MIFLDSLTIKGFKSILELNNFKLNKLNVLIGANGAGKSNFIEIFRMLRAMMDQNFANYILTHGGSDDFLFNGPKQTESIFAKFCFGLSEYEFELMPTVSEKFNMKQEVQTDQFKSRKIISANQYESQLTAVMGDLYQTISNWTTYHFHDTSPSAPMRRSEIVEDNKQLRFNADNIAPFLLNLRVHQAACYREIISAIQLVAPFFDDFILEVIKKGEKDTVKLSWKQKGSDYPMQPYHFSDGTIRFICLATALLQPHLPPMVVIDEPELGLHPYAIEVLAELIQSATQKTQVIVSTQSPELIDCFSPRDIVVVNRKNGASIFERLDADTLKSWRKILFNSILD